MDIMIERLKHSIHKPSTLLFLIGPLVVTIIFGVLVQKQQQDLVIPIAIVDQDQSSLSQIIVKRMKEHSRLVVYQSTEEKADDMLEKGEIDSSYVLSKDFQQYLLKENREDVIEVKTSSSSVASSFVKEVLGSEVTRITSSIKAANQVLRLNKQTGLDEETKKSLWNEAYDYTDDQWKPEPLMTIDYSEVSTDVAEPLKDSKHHQFNPFIGLWSFFTMVSCFLLSDWIIKEKQVFIRVRTTYAGLSSYFVQTSTANFLLQIMQSGLCFFLFTYFNRIEYDLLLFVFMIIYMYFCIGLASYSASLIKHVGSYYVFGVLVSLIVAVFSGSFFPIGELLGEYQFLTHLLPQTLFVQMDLSLLGLIYPFIAGTLLVGFSIGRLRIYDID